MTENLLKEAMDCGWVTMSIRVPPPPPVWKFVVDLSKRWSMMDEPDFLDLLDVTVRWEKEIPKGQGGANILGDDLGLRDADGDEDVVVALCPKILAAGLLQVFPKRFRFDETGHK